MTVSIWGDPLLGPAYCDHLTVLYDEGWPFGIISRRLGVSRNAAIAKAHRLQLPPRRERLVELLDSIKLEKKTVERRIVFKVRLPPQSAKAARILTAEYLCLIWALSDHTCRYPLWRINAPINEQFYCGAPAKLQEGQPYCQFHASICWQ